MFFSGSPNAAFFRTSGKIWINIMPSIFIITAVFQAYHSLFFFYFSSNFWDFYPRLFKRESFDKFAFRKFLSALIKQRGSWHAGQTEVVSVVHSWGLISSMNSFPVPHLSDYVWGAARNANTSKPRELLWRSRSVETVINFTARWASLRRIKIEFRNL